MTTKALEKKLIFLTREVRVLRRLVAALGVDTEGEYKPAFVKKVLNSVNQKTVLTYKGKGSLLKHIRTS